jgi:hypothetical protein
VSHSRNPFPHRIPSPLHSGKGFFPTLPRPVGSSTGDMTRCSLTLSLEGDPSRRFSVELNEDWRTLANDKLWQRIAHGRADLGS